MSRALRGRVRRLERRAGPPGVCRECGDRPPIRVVLPGGADPEGCGTCGRPPLRVRIMPRPVAQPLP